MRTFRVYFRDGNQRLFEAKFMIDVLNYCLCDLNYDDCDIVKIEGADE